MLNKILGISTVIVSLTTGVFATSPWEGSALDVLESGSVYQLNVKGQYVCQFEVSQVNKSQVDSSVGTVTLKYLDPCQYRTVSGQVITFNQILNGEYKYDCDGSQVCTFANAKNKLAPQLVVQPSGNIVKQVEIYSGTRNARYVYVVFVKAVRRTCGNE